MHLKNFSMIESPSGWVLSPAYDLLNVSILNPGDDEELALTLAGKKREFRRGHFEQFGRGLGLSDKQIEGAFKRMTRNRVKSLELISGSFLSDRMKLAYKETISNRFLQIDLSPGNMSLPHRDSCHYIQNRKKRAVSPVNPILLKVS
jgi:serine/threonine-protein kinase HipA